jgi:hypothetical protein
VRTATPAACGARQALPFLPTSTHPAPSVPFHPPIDPLVADGGCGCFERTDVRMYFVSEIHFGRRDRRGESCAEGGTDRLAVRCV